MPTIATTVRIPVHLQQRFDKLARATGRTRNFLMLDALERYIAREEWQVSETQATLARLEAGELELIPAEELIARQPLSPELWNVCGSAARPPVASPITATEPCG